LEDEKLKNGRKWKGTCGVRRRTSPRTARSTTWSSRGVRGSGRERGNVRRKEEERAGRGGLSRRKREDGNTRTSSIPSSLLTAPPARKHCTIRDGHIASRLFLEENTASRRKSAESCVAVAGSHEKPRQRENRRCERAGGKGGRGPAGRGSAKGVTVVKRGRECAPSTIVFLASPASTGMSRAICRPATLPAYPCARVALV
jgi:hypothetical protein